MSKRTTFTTISPLPMGISREVVLDFFHNHEGMIDLNPLVIERHPISPPAHAPPEEARCTWWSMTDKISYMPGVKSDLTYKAAFQDLHDGIQTHCYAPMGTHIRERWSLGGTLPGEPKQPVELGLGAPSQGLYIREDVEVRCNFLMAGFVKKTILKAHGVLVERLASKAQLASSASPKHGEQRASYLPSNDGTRHSQYERPNQQHQRQHSQVNDKLPPVYGNPRAAASETGLVPEPLYARRASDQYHMYSSGKVRDGQGWSHKTKPYIHDPYNPHLKNNRASQIPAGMQLGGGFVQPGQPGGWVSEKQSGPIAELGGSEAHAELQ
ncbi:hypothetical protein BJ170DRAFT_230596 [Xylariales sp. AK1849]|nr:hypothetical protein BJ170DRAFT_230596 [Xylariales sp. AK1849]